MAQDFPRHPVVPFSIVRFFDMGHNLRTREAIALGESENRSFYEIIEASSPFGWITFDHSILAAYEAGMRRRLPSTAGLVSSAPTISIRARAN